MRRSRGFTLVEVLVAIVLMGIVLPVAMRGTWIALSAASTARHTSEAAELAQAKLNEMLSTGSVTTFGSSGDFGQEWPQYQWTCQTVTDTTGLTQVSLSVLWQERGQQREFTLSTLTQAQ